MYSLLFWHRHRTQCHFKCRWIAKSEPVNNPFVVTEPIWLNRITNQWITVSLNPLNLTQFRENCSLISLDPSSLPRVFLLLWKNFVDVFNQRAQQCLPALISLHSNMLSPWRQVPAPAVLQEQFHPKMIITKTFLAFALTYFASVGTFLAFCCIMIPWQKLIILSSS